MLNQYLPLINRSIADYASLYTAIFSTSVLSFLFLNLPEKIER